MDVQVRINPGYKLYWRGRDRVGGEVIEVPEKEARLIQATKKGTIVKQEKVEVPEPGPVTYETAGTGEDSGASGHELAGRRRNYKRRDMRAEK